MRASDSIKKIEGRIKSFYSSGHEQSVKAKKNITASLVIKGVSIAINIVLVPLVLTYLGNVKYGIWVTLGSVITWVNFFDIGLSNGLRNKFTWAVAKNEKMLAKAYVSTTYFALTSISFVLLSIFLAVRSRINWIMVFNAPPEMRSDLEILVLIVFPFFLLHFILKIIGTVLLADQKPAISNSFNVISNIFVLICIFVLTRTPIRASIIHIGLFYSLIPSLVLLAASLYFYNTYYKPYRPSLATIKIKYFRSLMSLGVQYFVIHAAFVIIFATNNMIITQVLGPEHVPPYDIAFKYFNVIVMINAIIIQPFWSAFTFAFTKSDFPWLKRTMKKLFWINGGLAVVVAFMLAMSNIVYRFWVGNKVSVPFLLSVSMALYVVIYLFGSSFNAFIWGTGKLRLCVLSLIISLAINIPLSIFLAKFAHLGSSGVVFATCICNLSTITIIPIQYRKLVNKKACGIWNK